MKWKLARLAFGFPVLLLAGVAAGQSGAPVEITRIELPVRIDGPSDEAAWQSVPSFDLVQYEPNPGDPPTERTEVRVAYDDDFIYFSLRAFDRDPAGIRANSLYRDRLSGDDHFEVVLDTYNDNETAVIFTTTPAGMRKDAALSNDATGGTLSSGAWLNNDYNTFWDVGTAVTEEGWFAEMRVPFSSLKFQSVDGSVTMGFSVQRKIARRSERVVYPSIRPIANWAFLKPSLAQKIVLKDVYPRKPLYITPYIRGSASRAHVLDEAVNAYEPDDEYDLEVGGDLKYGLTNNATLDLTANTDFAQVEADDQQVNLTRFPLFFPEKRQFFQERAGIFDFRTGGLSRLFHSRRIGLTDNGAAVRIYGGARVVGRFGSWDVGALNMQTARLGDLPSENFGVLRLRHEILNAYSFAGAMATSRVGTDGTYNVGYGLDAVLRLVGDDYLTVKWSQTFDSDDEAEGLAEGGRAIAELQRRRREGFGYTTGLVWSGPDYDPGIGFTQRTDFTQFGQELSWSWIPGPSSGLLWHTVGVEGEAFFRNEDGSVESAFGGPEWEFGHRSGSNGDVEAAVRYEDLREPFELSDDAIVPVGSYTFVDVGAAYNMPHTSLLQLNGEVVAGSFYDGWQATLTAAPKWYQSAHLELGGEYLYSRIRFPERNQDFDAHVVRLRIRTALDTKLSLNAFVQYNSNVDLLSANVRFRYNFREGNDLWLVYNEGVNTETAGTVPALPRSDNRSLSIKYTYTFLR